MNQAIVFIINPASRYGHTGRNLKSIVREIKKRFPSAEIAITHHALHATGLTREAVMNGARCVVAVGGDGTLNEVVNGLFSEQGTLQRPDVCLGVLASGTGGDFQRTLGVKASLEEGLDRLQAQKEMLIDVGLVTACDSFGKKTSRYFINEASFGLSGLVAGLIRQVTKTLGGRMAYFLATVEAIRRFTPATIIMKEGNKEKATVSKCSLVTFANGQYYGSGMHIAPDAHIDDGLFDRITIRDLNVLFFLRHGYRVYRGTHLGLQQVQIAQMAECYVEAVEKMPIYVETDGELFAQLPATFTMKPKTLRVLI